MFAGGALQHERDDQESPVLDHVLLHRLRCFHQFTDEAQQLGANDREIIIYAIIDKPWLRFCAVKFQNLFEYRISSSLLFKNIQLCQNTHNIWCMVILTHHSVGSRLMSPRPSWAISSCEKSGNSTWMPPIELRVQCIECVTTAFTSCKSKFQFNQSSINRLSCHQPRIFCTGHVRQASCCCSFSSSAPSTPYDLCVVYPRNYYKIY